MINVSAPDNYVPLPLPTHPATIGRGTYCFGTDPAGDSVGVGVKLRVRSVT